MWAGGLDSLLGHSLGFRVTEGNGADLIVLQPSLTDSVDSHRQTASWIGADHLGVGFDPVGGMIFALLGGEQRDGGLQCIQTEPTLGRQMDLSTSEFEAVARFHVAGAVPFNRLDLDSQIEQVKFGFRRHGLNVTSGAARREAIGGRRRPRSDWGRPDMADQEGFTAAPKDGSLLDWAEPLPFLMERRHFENDLRRSSLAARFLSGM